MGAQKKSRAKDKHPERAAEIEMLSLIVPCLAAIKWQETLTYSGDATGSRLGGALSISADASRLVAVAENGGTGFLRFFNGSSAHDLFVPGSSVDPRVDLNRNGEHVVFTTGAYQGRYYEIADNAWQEHCVVDASEDLLDAVIFSNPVMFGFGSVSQERLLFQDSYNGQKCFQMEAVNGESLQGKMSLASFKLLAVQEATRTAQMWYYTCTLTVCGWAIQREWSSDENQFGRRAMLSEDGQFAAIASKGKVTVYTTVTAGLLATLTPKVADDSFGDELRMSSDGSVVAIGCPQCAEGRGRLTVYQRSGSKYDLASELEGATAGGGLGRHNTVGLSEDGQVLVIGDPEWDETRGRIRVLERVEPPATGDANGDGSIDIFDVLQIINIVLQGDYVADADLNSDGGVDIFDLLAVINIILSRWSRSR